MERLKNYKIIAILLAFSLMLLVGCGSKQYVLTTGFERTELMRINGVSTYLPQMMLYLTTVQNQYEEIYGESIWSKPYNDVSLEDRVKDMVLAKLAQIKVMNLMASEYELTLDEVELEKINKASDEFYAGLNDVEKETLKLTRDDIFNAYSEYALAEKVYDYVIKDVNPEISDDEARTLTVQEILIKTYSLDANGNKIKYSDRGLKEARDKARLVKELAMTEGESFEALQAKYDEGGIKTCSFGRDEVEKAIEDAAFSLSLNEVSDVIETVDGYYIIKCISDFDLLETQANKLVILKERKSRAFNEQYELYLKSITKILNKSLYDSIKMIHDPQVKTSTFFDANLF